MPIAPIIYGSVVVLEMKMYTHVKLPIFAMEARNSGKAFLATIKTSPK